MAKGRARTRKAKNKGKQQSGPRPNEIEVNARLARHFMAPLSESAAEDEVALALSECIKAVEVQLWDANADWTNAARIWTNSTLHPLFLKAVVGGRHWRIYPDGGRGDRWMVLSRLARMVGWALVLAGQSKLVDVHHAEAAFEKLHCYPRKDSEPMFWCEP